MEKIVRNALIVLIVLIVSGLTLSSQGQWIWVLQLGNNSCESWLREHVADARYGTQIALGQSAWVLGYVSGEATALDAFTHSHLPPTTNTEILDFMTKYCRDHPLASIHEAADQVLWELKPLITEPIAAAPH